MHVPTRDISALFSNSIVVFEDFVPTNSSLPLQFNVSKRFAKHRRNDDGYDGHQRARGYLLKFENSLKGVLVLEHCLPKQHGSRSGMKQRSLIYGFMIS